MKKLVFMMVAFAAISLASCKGQQAQTTEATDSTVVDSACTDSAKCDSACADSAKQACDTCTAKAEPKA